MVMVEFFAGLYGIHQTDGERERENHCCDLREQYWSLLSLVANSTIGESATSVSFIFHLTVDIFNILLS